MTGWRTLLHRIDWDDLRALGQSAPARYVYQMMGLSWVGGLAVSLVPSPFAFFVRLYLVWMVASLGVGMCVYARGWVAWMVGTLLFSLAMNALGAWYLMTLSV